MSIKEIDKMFREKIENGKVTHAETEVYAIQIGKEYSEAIKNVISSGKYEGDELSDKIYDLLISDRENVNIFATKVQQILNDKNGIGLKPIEPVGGDLRIHDLVEAITSAETKEKSIEMAKEPVVTLSQAFADNYQRANYEFHGESGLNPVIKRVLTGRGCDWCKSLAGTYKYPVSNKEVFRRHQRCRCIVIYEPQKGKAQDVHTKKWYSEETKDAYKASKMLEDQQENGPVGGPKDSAGRLDQYGHLWQKESFSEILDRFAEGSDPVPGRGAGKLVYTSGDGRYNVVYDTVTNYFRIVDSSLPGNNTRRKYVGLNGENMNNIEINGKIRGRTKAEYEAATHFLNSDIWGE